MLDRKRTHWPTRLMAAFLAFVMLLGNVPAGVFATEIAGEEVAETTAPVIDQTEPTVNVAEPENETAEELAAETVDVYVNPLYADVITEEMVRDNAQQIPAVMTFREPEYVSYANALELLREQLTLRAESTTLYIRSETRLSSSYYVDLFHSAMEHTGNPKQGDYLHCNMGGCEFLNLTEQTEDGVYYYTATFCPVWFTTAEMEEEMDAAVDSLLTQLNLWDKSDYRKIRGVYDYICGNIKYDYDTLDDDSYKLKYTAYAALVNKTAVCQGFASLYYRLMLELGVDCRYISGWAGDENHGWNIVRLDDVYYNVDVTWDAGITVYYRYFLCTPENFPDHARSSEFTSADFMSRYPMATMPYVVNVQASGTLNNGMKWVLDGDTGILTVSGTGAMPNWGSLDAPWYPYAESIRGAVLTEGITSVGDSAFHRCKNMTSVQLPSTLTRIGEYGFDNCRSLKQIELPEGLRTIDAHAFSECTALREIVIPSTVTSFGSSVFSNCYYLTKVTFAEGMKSIPSSMFFNSDSLKSVVFPSTLTEIGNTAFRMCDALTEVTLPASLVRLGTAAFADCTKLKNIYVEDGNTNFMSKNGVLFSKDGKTLWCFPAARTGTYTIPDGTVTIANAAFGSARISNVIFPDSVKTIDTYGFARSWLREVVVGEGVEYVGDTAFGLCDYLTKVTFGKALREIDSAFSYYRGSVLREVVFTGDAPRFDSYTFYTTTVTAYYPSNNPTWTSSVRQNYRGTVTWKGMHVCAYDAVVTAPTCTEQGYTTHTCTCGDSYVDSYTAPLGHSYEAVVTAPTCTEQGYTTHTCECGDSYVDSYVDATGHTYENGICTGCGKSELCEAVHPIDFFVFAGQSNMMGAAVLEPEVDRFTNQAWEYKYMPKLRGMETGFFVSARNPAGEWHYIDMDAAYGDQLSDLSYQSFLSNYGANTYFCPAMRDGTKSFSAQSEADTYPGASLAPYFVTEYAEYGHSSVYAHMAKGAVKIDHYFTEEMATRYNALISEYNTQNNKSYSTLTLAGLSGAGDAFDNKYNAMLEDYAALAPNSAVENKCFVWLQGEGDAGRSYIEYKLKMQVLWEHLQDLGFTHFLVLRVGYWGSTGILNVIKAQEDFCAENENCHIVTRAPSLVPHPGATTDNWWISEPSAEYDNCRDSYLVDSNNNHFNEKAMQIFAERSAENVHRILHLGLEPVLEEENIRGMQKEEELPEDDTPYTSYVGTEVFRNKISISKVGGTWKEQQYNTASTDLIPVSSDDSVWIQYVFFKSDAHAVGGFYDADGQLVAPLWYEDFGFTADPNTGGVTAFRTPVKTNRVSVADLEAATGKKIAYVRFTAWAASAGGHAGTEARIYHEEHTHRYDSAVTAPTCIEQGYTTHTCECGDSYIDSYVERIGHSYVNGVCNVCGVKLPSLDDVAWENLTYRDIFITNNLAYVDNFDTGTFEPHKQHMGVNIITDAAYSTPPYSLYASGDSSQQLVSNGTVGEDGNYFVACRSYCTRYVTGTLGFCVGPGSNNVGVREVTEGFVTCVDTLHGYSYSKIYIGSCNAADLDGYVDDPVAIFCGVFTMVPTESEFAELYETYLEIERVRHRHTEVVIPGVAPTYTESGLTEGRVCSDCGEVILAQQKIPAAYDGSELPVGYSLMEYLESIDGAYIDTGIAAGPEDKFILYAAALSNSNHSLFGSGTNSSSADRVQVHYGTNYGNNDSGYTLRFFGEMSEVVNVPLDEMISFVLDLENSIGYINGDTVLEQLKGTVPTEYPIYLFGKNVSGQPDPTYTDDTRIYAYKHYRNGILVRDMLPCLRQSDGEYGMYDLVENKFYANAGEGSLFFDALDLTGGGGIVMNMDTGEIYYGKNIHWKHGMASTTKIMTCILALENLKLDSRTVNAIKTDLIGGTTMGLTEGESLTVLDALYGLMLPSGNDAAQLLARTVAGDYDAFVTMMNQKAAELGMTETLYTNASGRYDDGLYTTVYDMTILFRYAFQNETFRQLISTKNYQIKADSLGTKPHNLKNTNELLWAYEGILGGKTGTTSGSGAHLITAARRHGTTLVAMILGSDSGNRFLDVSKLLDCGFEQAPEHVYTPVGTAPTCTEQGYTTHSCECGDEYVDSYVDALGHNYEGVYCVRCGEKNPDLTDCPENPVSTEWPRVNTDLSHIICYGQSFSVGSDAPLYADPAVDGVYVYGSLTNSSNGKSLSPIPTTGNQHAIISAGNVLARLLAEGGYNTDLVLGSYGSGGRTIAQLMSKDRQQQIQAEEGYTYDCLSSGRYEVFETSVDALAEFADNSGKSISCPVIVYLQGETDQNTDAQLGYPDNPNRAGYGAGGDKEKYKQYMTWLKEDMQSKVMEAYGQTEKPLFVIYQVSGTYVRTQYSSINMAQIEFAQENEDVILVQTPYFTSHYTGTHHLSQNGYRWLGEYIGRYVHTALTQRVKPWPMLPEKFEILSENTIRIRVSGAENGLSIDTYTVENATNSKNRYGFNILVDGTNVVPKTVEVSGSEIILTMPDGAASLLDAQTVYVQYAGQKAQGTGNIRDNCTEVGFYEYLDDRNDIGTDKKQSVSHSSLDEDGNSIIGKKYPLYNWLASFSYRVNTNDLHVHNYVETVIAPTCSTRGYTAYACACGDAYAGEFVDATGIHTYEAVVTEPTCTEGGYTTYICTCGDVREITDHTDPLGHKEVVDARVLPTAGKTGLTEGSHCAACGEILKAREVIPATGYEKALEDGAFKVLLVGNTFSEDAANYGYGMTDSQLLGILQGMLGEEMQVTVGLIHYSASSLAWHATQAHQNTSRYAFRVIDSEKGKWETVGTVSSAAALQWADWDAVVLQPFSVEAISGKANPIHADQEDAQFYPLENSTSYMLDHVNRYAPDAEIYCFMHWQRYNLIKLNVGLSQHNTMADFFPVVMDYRGSESGARYDEIIPVGTAVQNARTTYLSLLSYHTDGKVTLKEDPQFGLQRDVNHLSLNVGRYIAALTFAETLIPEEIRAEGYVVPEIRTTESVGRLPKEYTTLAQKAAQAAVISWKNNSSLAVTEIEGYREDPTVAAAEKLAAVTLEIPCALDVADLQSRIMAAALEELPEDFNVDAVAFAEGFVLNAEGQNFTATVTIRFGYTGMAVAVGVTVGGHDYEAVVTPPTCTEQGFTTHTCYCGDSYIDSYVDAVEHKFGEWTLTTEPTCTEKGEERRDCANCDHFETREVEAMGHDYETVVTKPTCIEKGYTTHTCHCGDSYVDSYVDAVGHKFGDWEIVDEPTCTEQGEERRDCANCDHFETREVEAIGHDYEAVVTKPTCTEKGFTTHTCHCGDSYIDSYVNAAGHKFGDWEIVEEPTCTEKGVERRDCENCDRFETREVEAIGHDYETVVTKPTCTDKGFTTHTCHCGDSYVDSYVEATGHKFGEWEVVNEPTCTEKGEERRDCANCDHFETREVAATGHDYEAVVTKPTCSDKGFTTHTCHCGDSYIDSYVDAVGHKFGEWTVTTEPNCTEKGAERRDCENCDHFETREVAASGHDYEAVVTAPTCTDKGFTTHTCHCGDSYIDSYVNALGHEYGEWYVTKQATLESEGEERRDCDQCDDFQTRKIPKLVHNYTSIVIAPTCTEQGYTTHTCQNCGDKYVDTYVNALGHNFADYVSNGDATCTSDGTKTAECERCDETDTIRDAGTAKGHSFGDWAVVDEPTCTEKGKERRDCENCDHFENREVDAIGHDYEAIVTAPTCVEKGYTTHTCHCGDSHIDSYVDAVGHKFGEWTVTTEPSCTEKGEERRDCENCDRFETREVEATGHDYEAVVTKPTCVDKGYTTHTCHCGDSYVDSYVAATGHKFGDWTVITEPTCTKNGEERRECANCDHFDTREIEAIGHDYEAVVTKPTCVEKGYTTHNCSKCGDSYVDGYVNAPGHKYENGSCAVCGEPEVKYLRGDVDLDGDVDVDDVLALLWYVLFPEDYPIEVDADFDRNGSTDVDDVLALLWYVLFPEDYPLN